MKRLLTPSLAVTAALIASVVAATDVAAQVIRAFAPRVSVNQAGDITLIGNTIMTCSGGGSCTNGRNGTGNSLNNNDHTMVYVDTDGDASTFSSSSATLTLPAGASVSWAGLYWGGDSNNALRSQVRFGTPAAAYATLTATQLDVSGSDYQGFIDVTARVQAGGAGVYRMANVRSTNNSANRHGGWALIVVYSDAAQPMRNLIVFDGYASVAPGASVSFGVSGFVTPPAGIVRTRLGAVSYEGDLGYTGDAMRLNATALTNARNPATNFFNSSISLLGTSFTAKNPNYLNQFGFDADIVSADGILANSASSATIQLTSTDDQFYPGVVTFATDLYAPVFDATNFTKTVTDLNGGQVRPGDVLEYLVTMRNVGQDHAGKTVMRDTLPAGVTYEPGTLAVVSGPNVGGKTDAAGDDQMDYLAASRTVVARLGTSADASGGGLIQVGEQTSVRFRVRVAPATPHGTVIPNQGWLSFVSQQSGVVLVAASDGDAAAAGAQPTRVTVFAGVDLTGVAYSDLDHDGTRDVGEPGTGVALWAKLTPAGSATPVQVVAVTPATGAFAFTDVTPGSYDLRLDTSASGADLTPDAPAGWLRTQVPTGLRAGIAVAAATVGGQDFGLFHGGRVSGVVFRDDGGGGGSPNDGVRQAGEAPRAAIRVQFASSACPGGACDSTLTSATGVFTLWFPHTAAGAVQVRERDLSLWRSTGASVGTSGGSYARAADAIAFTAVSGEVDSGLAFGDVPPHQWAAPGVQNVAPGGVATHAHRFVAGSAGALSVIVSQLASPPLPGWGAALVRDLDCDGVLDAGEPLMSAPITLLAGESACMLLRHSAPPGAPAGAAEQAQLTARFDFIGAVPVLVSADTLADLTTVSVQNGLVLVKAVDRASAQPGDTLTYTLTYTNPGAQTLSGITIADATPAWTVFVDASCLTLGGGLSACSVSAQPAPGGSGNVTWTLTGSLAPGASGSVRYRVRVQPQ